MGNYSNDSRIVLTLDAGGTNMVFGAMRGEQYICEPITLPANANDLDLCLKTMVVGFESVMNVIQEKPVAISFAFPGPADYPNGIIGGYLPNFPSFRDGVALGPVGGFDVRGASTPDTPHVVHLQLLPFSF